MSKTKTISTAADTQWGFEFGFDGVVTQAFAMEQLGGVSVDTIERLCAEGKLRRGKFPGGRRVSICRRSLRVYIRSQEQ